MKRILYTTLILSCIALPLIAGDSSNDQYYSALPNKAAHNNRSFNRWNSPNYKTEDQKDVNDFLNSLLTPPPLKPNGLLSFIVGTSIGLYNAHLYEKYSDRLRWHWIIKWFCFSLSRGIFTEGFIQGSAGLIDGATCRGTAWLADWISYLYTCFTNKNNDDHRDRS